MSEQHRKECLRRFRESVPVSSDRIDAAWCGMDQAVDLLDAAARFENRAVHVIIAAATAMIGICALLL